MTSPTHCPECGAVLVQPRSLADHRRFFGLVRAAFMNWPEAAPFQPSTEEALRGYLLVEANHYDVEFIAYPESSTPEIKKLFRLAVEATHTACTRGRSYSDTRVSAGGIEIRTPKSIDFRSVGQKAFGPIREAVEHIIETAIGVKCEQLLKERAA